VSTTWRAFLDNTDSVAHNFWVYVVCATAQQASSGKTASAASAKR
jgi:hypothetical protein